MPTETERYFADLLEIEKLLSRVDERVQGIMKSQDDFYEKNNESSRLFDSVRSDIHKLELRVQELESNTSNQEGRWKTIIGFGIQLVWVILAAFLLYKLGISSPPVP
jgi:hypothetical protein